MSEIEKTIMLEVQIKDAIEIIDPSLSVKTFAHTIALVLSDNYGAHNYETFLSELKTKLK